MMRCKLCSVTRVEPSVATSFMRIRTVNGPDLEPLCEAHVAIFPDSQIVPLQDGMDEYISLRLEDEVRKIQDG